jgi:hypothetical protein
MDWLKSIFGGEGGVSSVVKSVGDAVGQFVTKPEDTLRLQQALAEADLKVRSLAFEAEKAYLQDRASARELYGKDNSLQKVFALTFLLGYFALTAAVLWFLVAWVGGQKVGLPDWGVALISTIYGAMSTKVSTIVDFFFGSSQGSQDKTAQVQAAMAKIPSQ